MAARSDKIAVRTLKDTGDNPFCLVPDATFCAEIAAFLDLLGLRKLRFEGTLRPIGETDWLLEATLGATVTQPCIITAKPVVTRIQTPIRRRLLADPPQPNPDEDTQFDGDDEWDPLESQIDLGAIMTESLALHLPEFPRLPGATLGDSAISVPESAENADQPVKPFASLAALRDKLKE